MRICPPAIDTRFQPIDALCSYGWQGVADFQRWRRTRSHGWQVSEAGDRRDGFGFGEQEPLHQVTAQARHLVSFLRGLNPL